MDTRLVIENSFKELLIASSYKNVSVSDICKKAGISRKTFYEYFHSKEDIVRSYFERNSIESMRFIHDSMEYLSPDDLMRSQCAHLYYTVKKDSEYYMRLIGDGLGDSGGVFVRGLTNAIYQYNHEVFDRTIGEHEDSWRFEYSAYFFASSQAMYIKKWVQDGMKVPPDELSELYIKMTSGFWNSLHVAMFDTASKA